MKTITQFTRKFRQGLIIFYLLDRLENKGICIRPVFLMQEGLENPHTVNLPQHISIRLIEKAEFTQCSQHIATVLSVTDFQQRFSEGCQCFGIFDSDVLIGFSWCHFSYCRSWIGFPLNEGQVYLFDARIVPSHRGRELAVTLRKWLYSHLTTRGYREFLSITDAVNSPAKRFKHKLKAKPLSLHLVVILFRRYKKNILLKQFSTQSPGLTIPGAD